MICIGIEAAGKTAGVAIFRDDTLLYESTLNAGLTHSESLLPLLDAACKAAGVAVGDAELLAVCAGPGSFTGLRIGMALVKGLAMATGAQCAPVSTLEALACIAPGAATVVTALDARRGQVYAAAFENTPNGPVRLLPDDACSPAALADFVAWCKKPLVFVGDGAEICYNIFENVDGVQRWPGFLSASRAAGVCRAGLRMYREGRCVPAEQMRPDYHRLSQAERERAARLAAQ